MKELYSVQCLIDNEQRFVFRFAALVDGDKYTLGPKQEQKHGEYRVGVVVVVVVVVLARISVYTHSLIHPVCKFYWLFLPSNIGDLREVIEFVRAQKQDAEILVFSKMNSDTYCEVTAYMGVVLRDATWAKRPHSDLPDFGPFTWFKSNENSEENRIGYMGYLWTTYSGLIGMLLLTAMPIRTC
jgi:hypothetical protein